ncbi:mannose-1-phosphate guanylyltransferase/mannose-6-phosphate isomerase [Thermodesulfobacterium hydrogeniphilum]|uniref:mannose-1-phosphate guanylyltransferase/mannose-6-phosphate isomerase n=1 Tax=Thermodesulfobacterium hydrogeniphilum TaxID=161156 RepID=UPI00056E1DCB|nr:mannose-1-phosphate guanylyltransferase/mannose-6-phosphate isomerase [Thermodesulfobacterium hydrogeniphilum]
MKAVILAGGSGTRLWPLSRRTFPKQFLKLNGNKSLLQKTVERFLKVVNSEDIIIMTNKDYKFLVLAELKNAGFNIPEKNIVLEPAIKNTAPAIALAMKFALEKMESNQEDVLFVSPSDHIIKPEDKFLKYLEKAETLAKKGYIVTFGIKPEKPETGYGYIKAKNNEQIDEIKELNAFPVEKFTEKPDLRTAKKYLSEGNYFWNSGMFCFGIKTMQEEFAKFELEIAKIFDLSFEETVKKFSELPEISIDYAVMEKTNKAVVLPLDIYWSDIGSWAAVYEALDKDEAQNVKTGEVISVDTKNSLILGNKRLVVACGVEDLAIIDTDDAILILKKDMSQRVKDIVNLLKKDGHPSVLEHKTVFRPWGSYTVLEEGARYKIKKVVVNPGAKLSLQMHYHRSEHWIVVRGTAKVTVGDKEIFVHENESVFVPPTTLHRIENPGRIPLEIIEVQSGEYLEEDDIVRFDDVYGRNNENTKN